MKNKILSRRELIRLSGLALAGGAILPSCVSSIQNSNPVSDSSGIGSTTGSTATGGACAVIPSETAGPYPAHDDSAINCLTLPGIERSDIRSSLNAGSYTGTAVATGLRKNSWHPSHADWNGLVCDVHRSFRRSYLYEFSPALGVNVPTPRSILPSPTSKDRIEPTLSDWITVVDPTHSSFITTIELGNWGLGDFGINRRKRKGGLHQLIFVDAVILGTFKSREIIGLTFS